MFFMQAATTIIGGNNTNKLEVYSNGPGTQPEHLKVLPVSVNSDRMLITFDNWPGASFNVAAQNVDVKVRDGNGLPLAGIVKNYSRNLGAYVHYNRTANNFPADAGIQFAANDAAFREQNAWYNVIAEIDKIALTINVTFTNKTTGVSEILAFAYDPAKTDGKISSIQILMGQSGQNTIYFIDNIGIYEGGDEDLSPTITVAGPEVLTKSDTTATYKFSLANMPANTGALTMTLRVEDAFFTGQSLYPLGDWVIVSDGPWVQNREYWDKTVTFGKAGGTTGDSDFYEIVLNIREGAIGITEVAIIDASAATPGGIVAVYNAGPAVTEVIPFSRYDVNRDGVVDLADVASAAYFFMTRDTDSDWFTLLKFDNIFVSPERCDVDSNGIVDIEDLILILANIGK
jgi:hypothetical protein